MTPFPTFEPRCIRHAAYDGLVTFLMRYRTLGTKSFVNRLYDAFKLIAPKGTPETDLYARATLLAHTGDIEFAVGAAEAHPALAALASFWAWRKTVSDEQLVESAEQVWGWFENDAPLDVVLGEWDDAFGASKVSRFAAPRALQPVENLTTEELADPNFKSGGA